MNTIAKKIIFVIAFVLVTLVLPAVLLLLFVDATTHLSTYFVVFAVIIFAVMGYVVISVREMNKNLEKKVKGNRGKSVDPILNKDFINENANKQIH